MNLLNEFQICFTKQCIWKLKAMLIHIHEKSLSYPGKNSTQQKENNFGIHSMGYEGIYLATNINLKLSIFIITFPFRSTFSHKWSISCNIFLSNEYTFGFLPFQQKSNHSMLNMYKYRKMRRLLTVAITQHPISKKQLTVH